MKKILSLFVCLVLLGAGTAFTLDLPDALKIPGLTVTGDVRTGLQVSGGTVDDYGKLYDSDPSNAPETGAIDPEVYAWSDDLNDGTPFRAQLQLVWERDNLGVKTRFRYRPDTAGNLNGKLNDLNNTVNKAFVYGWLLDKKVKVTAGKSVDGAWGLFYSNFNSGKSNTGDFDGKDGIHIQVLPIAGLNVGAFYGTGNLFANAFKSGSGPGLTDQGTERRLTVGAKYTSDFFSVVASTYHNFNQVNDSDYPAPKQDLQEYADAALFNTSNLLVGVKVNPIEALQIDLSLLAVNIGAKTLKAQNGGDDVAGYKKGDYNPYTAVFPKLKVEYAINDTISAGLVVKDIIFADAYYTAVADADDPEDKGQGALFPITFNPFVSYGLSDDISVSLDLNFKINIGGSDQFGFGLTPGAEFSLGSGAKFVVFDELFFYTKANDDSDFRAKHPNFDGANGGASGTSNALQFDFVWTF
ncbi:MAG: hypothetical protein LBF83_09090 [Spirochaetaceae bacterium]|nr:hypothetical protein [Spirochaetaceae bacterium]